jgi:hypothetical protein
MKPQITVDIQARRVWRALTSKAARGSKTTYGALATAIGYSDPRAGYNLWRALWIVGEFCKAKKLPALNTIVVLKRTGKPGDGVVTRRGWTVPQEQAAVMRKDWSRFDVPATATFREVWKSLV